MPWFSRNKEDAPWEDETEAPVGDIETAHKIRDICNFAASSAQKLAAFNNRPSDKTKKNETARYDRARKRALVLAKQISDDLLRDTAVRQIVNLCVSAGDVETAKILIGAIQTKKIREEMLNEHPSLR
jgi:hypothetical protein